MKYLVDLIPLRRYYYLNGAAQGGTKGDKKMEQVSSEMMKMLERMAAQMLNDGVTPEMFKNDMDAFTRAYMEADIKKTEEMTTAYFTKPDFRREVIITTAQMATA